MSNETTAVPASGRSALRAKLLPVAIGVVALLGAGVTWVIASPSTPVRTGPPQVGDLAPEIALEGTGGGTWRLSEQRGREVLLVFFRTHT